MKEKLLTVKLLLPVLLLTLASGVNAMTVPTDRRPPAEDGIWLRPAAGWPGEPIIGFKNGIRIGLWPAPSGPRGIIRIYTPYVFPGKTRELINFIAIEPIVKDWRSLSELEHSALDDRRGKRLWFSNHFTLEPKPELPWDCTRGKTGVIRSGGKTIRTLTIVINVEKLDNGAQPIVVASFREDRPHEVAFRCYSAKDGAPMVSCVLTATMGNASRARLLWLKDEVVDSLRLWPGHEGHDFFWTPEYPIARARTDQDGTITVAITPNEKDPASVKVDPDWWGFPGVVATQYWRKYPGTLEPPAFIKVNGRAMYYGTGTKIPGGVAYENFELIEKYESGVESVFGVTLKTPAQMGWKIVP